MEKVSDVYPSLYHYTNWAGLQGILSSQSMWASNIKYLNDQSELTLARDPIYRLLLPKITAIIKELTDNSLQGGRFVKEQGGLAKIADHETRDS